MKKILSVLTLFYATSTAMAQEVTTDTSRKINAPVQKDSVANVRSDVKTMNDEEYNAWLKGADLKPELSLVAEMNNYPTAEKVLKLKKQLDLSPIQIRQLNDIIAYLKLKKVEAGGDFIRNERTLDSLFRTKKINEASIIFYGNRYGLYLGEYRTSILIACRRTRQLLTDRQLARYVQLQNRH